MRWFTVAAPARHYDTRMRIIATTTVLLLIATTARAEPGGLVVDVLDKDGAPVPGVAVYAVPADGALLPPTALERPTAIMDQHDRAFVPHLLVVRTGTEIHFPNSDSVSHHVYSFSKTLPFALPLYTGDVHPPLLFDTSGIVTLGCNIHDDMVGYVLVVDTPYFGTTSDRGSAKLASLPPGRYRVQIWTPRLRPGDVPAAVEIDVSPGTSAEVSYRFTSKLLPGHDRHGSSLKWSHY